MRAARHFPVKHLFLYVLPIPKGVPTAPELLAREPAPWAEERAQLAALVARFGGAPARAAWPEHPLFGPLTAHEWGTLTYKHVDHHLRQFGV
jgi:hypothetical protein